MRSFLDVSQGFAEVEFLSGKSHVLPTFFTESTPLNMFRANRNTTLICYKGMYTAQPLFTVVFTDFIAVGGAYIKSDEVSVDTIPQKLVHWELPWKKVAFVPPFVFGFSGNLVEVRNICTGALVQVIKMEADIRCDRVSNSPEIRDGRADFFKKWDAGEESGGTTSSGNSEGLALSAWGPIFFTSEPLRIVQLAPRSHPEFIDSRLFHI